MLVVCRFDYVLSVNIVDLLSYSEITSRAVVATLS